MVRWFGKLTTSLSGHPELVEGLKWFILLLFSKEIFDTRAVMRVLGLDVGEKTVGVAVSDPMGWTAQPVETIRFKTPSEAFSRLAALIEELGVEEIVCGLPLNMNGTEGPQAAFVRKFMEGVVK